MAAEVRRLSEAIVCVRRASLARCLALRPAMVCPGHREPLTSNVDVAVAAMQKYLESGGSWPLLG